MIDSFVKVLDKLVELAKYRELKREKRFNTIVKPMFDHRKQLLPFIFSKP